MSTPNPLIPQGSLQTQGASSVRVAVATIVAIHVVFFGGLLLQGCKRDAKLADGAAAETNAPAAALTYPPIDSNSLYYSNAAALPAETPLAPANAVAGAGAVQPEAPAERAAAAAQPDPWKSANLAGATPSAAAEQTLPGREYTVARGDSYSKIAKTQGTTIAALKKANPDVDPLKIQPGQKLIVPAGAPAGAEHAAGVEAAGGGAPAGNFYTVKAGDNLTKIARAHGVSLSQLRAANNMKVSRVNVGQKLKIPAAAGKEAKAAAPQAASAATNHTF